MTVVRMPQLGLKYITYCPQRDTKIQVCHGEGKYQRNNDGCYREFVCQPKHNQIRLRKSYHQPFGEDPIPLGMTVGYDV